jgi:hypothetical protein
LLQTAYNHLRKLLGSAPIQTAILATLIIGLLIGGVAGTLNVFKHLTQNLTTTVTAATESLSFSLAKGTQSSWVFPPGRFLGPDKIAEDPACEVVPPENPVLPEEFICTLGMNTRVVIDGAATVTHTVTPTGGWSTVITKGDDPDASIQLLDGANENVTTYERELRFSSRIEETVVDDDLSGKSLASIRFPIIAATARVGGHIRYAVGVGGTLDDFWQPTLLSGNVATYGLNRPDTGKYQILSERLDTGDIIEIDTKDREFHMPRSDSIWGVVTIENRTVLLSDTTETKQYVIYAVLHTTHRWLTVRRFGAVDGHQIKASGWDIIAKWPNGQEAWVFFVSSILVLTFVIQLADPLKRKRLKSKKKGKKHSKRKRKGD